MKGFSEYISSLALLCLALICHHYIEGATPPPFKTLEFVTEPVDTVAKRGDRVWLHCSAKYDQRAPTVYSWKRNDVLLNSWATGELTRYVMQNGSLFFSSMDPVQTPPDPAHYKCIAEVTVGTKVHRIATPAVELALADSPELISKPQNLNLYNGETAMFRCHSSARPQATYRWTRNSRPLYSSTRVILHSKGEVLEIKSVSNAEDTGQYRCTATNTAGQVESPSAKLTIHGGADTRGVAVSDFVMRPWDTSAVAGSTVTLFCAVNGTDSNRDLPHVTWLKKGSAIVNTRSYEGPVGKYSIVGSSSLQIFNISLEDEDVYTCRGDNLEDMSDAEATLSVKVPPYLVTLPKNTYGRIEEDIVLECQISGTPAPQVLWYKDSDIVHDSKYFKYVGHNLRIMGLMPTDSGYFQCMGINEVGKIQSVAQLIVLDADTEIPDEEIGSYTSNPNPSQTVLPVDPSLPPAPLDLRAAIVSQTYVTLTWNVMLRPGISPVTAYTITTNQLGEQRTRAINVSSTDCTVEGLLPSTQYIFSVTSHNRNGHSMRPTNTTVTTKAYAQVPEAVTNMRAWPTSHDSIQVTWDSPLVTFGPIISYEVYYYSQHQSKELFKRILTKTVTLNDLHPYTEYYIRVVTLNKEGAGTPTEEKHVRTFSAKPSGAPNNVTIEASGTSEISVRWTPPIAQEVNGQITGYKIRYKQKNSDDRATAHTTDADARSFDIAGLTAGVTYLVRIAALNINGTGEFTAWKDATTFVVELDESRVPGKPSFIQLKAFAREMIVTWGSTVDSNEILVRGYRLGYGIGFPEQHWVENIAHGTRIYSLSGLEPLKNYVVQVMAYNHAGDGPNAQQQRFTSEEVYESNDSKLLAPVEVKLRVISPTSVVLTWYDNTLGMKQKPLDDITVYTVKYNALSGAAQRKTQFRNTSALFMQVDGLRPYTTYEFSVMITRGNRVSIYSLGARNTTFEDKQPSTPPRDLTVSMIDERPNMLLISWQRPVHPNGKIISYTIYSTTDFQLPLASWIVESVEGVKLNHVFGPVTPSTVYFFRIAAHNSKGASPPSDTKAFKTSDSAVVQVNPGSPWRDEDKPPTDRGSSSGGVNTLDKDQQQRPGVTTKTQPQNGVPSAETLWIIIACVSAITALAIAALVTVICRKKILKERKRPANLKASNQAPKGMNKGFKQQPPDLWIDHEQVELKEKTTDPHGVIDEETAMLQSQSQFDMTSASMVGENYMDEPRYSTLGRQRPVIIAPQHHRDAMPRAAVQPMAAEHSRPLYPRTQFSSHYYGSTPRVHLGDTSQPTTETSSFCTDPVTGLTGVATPIPNGFTNGELESYNHSTSTPFNKPYMINGEEVPPPRPPPMEGRSYPVRSFNNANGTGHNIPKHIVKPQPMSAFKPVPVEPTLDSGSLKRPPRPPYVNRQLSQGSLGRDHLKMSLKSGSTEHLSSEMAHLDHIMQDLNSMKSDFETTA